jgi:lysophospholipase L1-like esterase
LIAGRNPGARLLLTMAAAGLVLAAIPLASGESRNAIVGPYSPARLALILLLGVPAALSLVAAALPGLPQVRRLAGLLRDMSSRAPLPELLPLLALPLLAVLWLMRPLPVFDDPRFSGGLAVAALSLPGAWTALLDRGRRRLALGRLGVSSAAVATALLAGELLARAMMPRLIFDPRFRLRPHMSYRIEVDLPGVSRGGRVTTNRWGLRGEEPPEEWADWTTIIAVGGSTTVNFYLADSLTWPAVMQRELREDRPRVWVGNGGVPAQSAETHDIFLREVVEPIGPDYALFLVGMNDIDVLMRPGRGERADRLPDMGPRMWLYRHSRLYQALYTARKLVLDDAVVVRETTDPPFDPQPLRGEASLPEDLHELMPRPGIYRDRIERLIETCREIGVRPVFLTQPLLYADTRKWRGLTGGNHWNGTREVPVSAATIWRMVRTLNDDLIAECAEEGVPCFDLAAEVPPDSRYFYDSMHFTEEGAELVGELVARFMEEEVLRPRPTGRRRVDSMGSI